MCVHLGISPLRRTFVGLSLCVCVCECLNTCIRNDRERVRKRRVKRVGVHGEKRGYYLFFERASECTQYKNDNDLHIKHMAADTRKASE